MQIEYEKQLQKNSFDEITFIGAKGVGNNRTSSMKKYIEVTWLYGENEWGPNSKKNSQKERGEGLKEQKRMY